jgi:alpha-1,2-mannosyltransferase
VGASLLLTRVFGRLTPYIWIAGLFFSALPLIADLRQTEGTHINAYTLIGRDFVNIWHGGQMVSAGDTAQVYDRPAYREQLDDKVQITGIYAYSYPPHMLAASIPFGWFDYIPALLLWTVLTFALFAYGARPWLAQAGLPLWSVLILPATMINIDAGHFGFLIGGLVLMGWWHARDRPLVSGFAFAVMTVKPHLGVLVPFILAAYRDWRTIMWAGFGSVSLVIASALFLGWETWDFWIKSTLPFQASLLGVDDPALAYPYMMPTVERMVLQIGLTKSGAVAAQIAFGVVAIGILAQGWRRGIDVGDLGLLSIPVTFIILPYTFNYDMVAFDLAILVLAARAGGRLSAFEKALLGFAFLMPAIHVAMALWGVAVTPLVTITALWILVRALGRVSGTVA